MFISSSVLFLIALLFLLSSWKSDEPTETPEHREKRLAYEAQLPGCQERAEKIRMQAKEITTSALPWPAGPSRPNRVSARTMLDRVRDGMTPFDAQG